ncbi:malonyl-CoA decarboxylase family protein [Pusillimonas sp. CC-YST705]|uniref:Malonyl-CoA decarboxylase family protein n=1 Tax=Mesopusillimonas faecipullorum TaxID=2755040 RepID=A0ABS8CE28_9BURK|nr:malonyl-CoA decarboxylase family protein [Mesopusillimonas faecipullorum]MCB5364289.1 malonyl-CoA decarboxylase family protein [Mesopusillimonas faecipullorum]
MVQSKLEPTQLQRNEPPAITSTQPAPDESRVNGLLRQLSRWFERSPLPGPQHLQALYLASPKDEAANRLAREWATRYEQAEDDQRRLLLNNLAQAGNDTSSESAAQLFRRLYAQSDNLELMVQLRADMLRWHTNEASLSTLEQPLAALLSSWFDVGMLEMRHINWDSPASLLEKLIQYEAVHEIRSWEDMRRRVAGDRRCYAFFHPRMSNVPLIFVEVALAENMIADVQTLLDPALPVDPLHKARWAIFYSISTTQSGLKGISFGNFLLKRVIEELKSELPKLKSFATLSPMPGFTKWLEKQSASDIKKMLGQLAGQAASDDAAGVSWAQRLQAAVDSQEPEALKRCGLRLAARYLSGMKGGQPIDAVARFHLGNGARIERLNWAADLSSKGRRQSASMMVNYLYEPEQLDSNRAQLEAGTPKVARAVQKL